MTTVELGLTIQNPRKSEIGSNAGSKNLKILFRSVNSVVIKAGTERSVVPR